MVFIDAKKLKKLRYRLNMHGDVDVASVDSDRSDSSVQSSDSSLHIRSIEVDGKDSLDNRWTQNKLREMNVSKDGDEYD